MLTCLVGVVDSVIGFAIQGWRKPAGLDRAGNRPVYMARFGCIDYTQRDDSCVVTTPSRREVATEVATEAATEVATLR